ncbi:pectin lyase-like protein [Mycena latifolia]|nr:pectin lyase-like protein [Mycena latifolia]
MLLSLLLLQASVALAWDTFTVPHLAGADDTPGLLALVTNHSSNATIMFSKGTTYNIFTAVKFPVLTNVEVRIEGNLTYLTNITAIQELPGIMVHLHRRELNVTLRGSTDPKWGWVDGHGQAWWDAIQEVNRPHGWAFNHITNGAIRDMKLWKPIGWNFATSVYNNLIMAVSDTSSFPFNTDGFSAGRSNLLFENNVVYNGDDCLTVGSGAINITWRNGYCEGRHGLSIGSLGEGGAVANVQNIFTLNNTHIQDFLFEGFSGTIRDVPYVEGSCITDPCWYFVPNATGREVAILDLYPGTATNVLAKDIFDVRTETGREVAVMCNATTVTNDVGFKCWDGPFIRTKAGL